MISSRPRDSSIEPECLVEWRRKQEERIKVKDEEEARRKQELREKARQELEAWYVCVVVTPDRFWLRMIFLSLFSCESNSRTSRPVSKSVIFFNSIVMTSY